MTTTDTGHQAEAAVADYLRQRGYKMLEQNWRTRWCEIDIVAQKDRRVYFVEVKYRRNANQGSGLDYITSQKLRQMRFAAEAWVADHEWQGDYQLAAAEVAGATFEIENFIDELL